MNPPALSLDETVQLTAAVFTLGCAYAAVRSFRTHRPRAGTAFAAGALIFGAAALFFGTFQIRLF